MEKIFALVDCNSFYCSCERLFRPDLSHKAVGVLSNNDGCFVSRSDELKSLGVKMGEPYFKVKELCQRNKVAVFSANFSLYTNMSDRVMMTLAQFTPELEVYSVDEAFLDLSGFKTKDLNQYAKEIKDTVEKNTGIPVSVGLGSTKTLAKMANHIAKKSKRFNGVCSLLNPAHHEQAMRQFPIGKVWGIGRKKEEKLKRLGIKTALQFRDYKNDPLIQKLFSKVSRATQDELRGIACLELNQEISKKKEIMCSRSFGDTIETLEELREAVAGFASNVTQKLRAQDSVCASVEVWIRSNPFSNTEQIYAIDSHRFQSDTSDTRKIIHYCFSVLNKLYKHGYKYKKAAVKLNTLRNSNEARLSLFESPDSDRSQKLMQTMDKINQKEGPETVRIAACGLSKRSWKMNQSKKSPRHLSGWSELPTVK